jgi:hypothetical protein
MPSRPKENTKVVVAYVRKKNRLRASVFFVWMVAWLMMPLLASAAENDLLTIEPAVSSQQMRQMHDPALQAILNVPAFGVLHLARAHTELLSDHANALRIDLGDGQIVTVHKTRFYTTSQGTLVWEGEISTAGPRARGGSVREVPYDENNTVTLVAMRDRMAGSVRVNGQHYSITPLTQGEHAVIKVDGSKLPQNLKDTRLGRASEKNPRNPPPTSKSRNAISTIRVLVVASRDAVDKLDGEDNLRLKAELDFVESNRTFANSDLAVQLDNAGIYPLAFDENGKDSTDILEDLADVDDQHLGAPVLQLRDEHRADLAVMVTNSPGICGRAYLDATKETAFSVVTWDCLNEEYTFAHEIGHNLGAHHSPEEAAEYGDFPYGAGYQQKTKRPRWRTIMAGYCSIILWCDGIGYWSDPDHTYNGLPIGQPNVHDNARVWRVRAPVVAAFYPPPETAKPPIADAIATPTTITGPQTVTLDSRGSSNPGGGELRYQWEQTGGSPAANLSHSSAAVATAEIPAVTQDTTFRFRVTVTNRDDLSAYADVEVAAKASNPEPIVGNLHIPTEVQAGERFTFSIDARSTTNRPLTYDWRWMGEREEPVGRKFTQIGPDKQPTMTAEAGRFNQDVNAYIRVFVRDDQNHERLFRQDVLIKKDTGGGEGCVPTDPEASSKPLWNATTTYKSGDVVQHNGVVWKASWQTSGTSPDKSDAFALVSDVPVPWDAARPYVGGTKVIYEGKLYRAQYWVGANTRPGSAPAWVAQDGPVCP